MLNSALRRLRRRRAATSIPQALRGGDRRDQRARLRRGQQRRLPGRLRHRRRRPTRRRSTSCSRRWTGWRSGWRSSATWPATGITEADWRLFTTLVRFDPVYVGHFKCNLRRIWSTTRTCGPTLRELYQMAGRRRDGQPRAHQAATTTAATGPSTRPASCRRGRRSIIWHPTAASDCWRPDRHGSEPLVRRRAPRPCRGGLRRQRRPAAPASGGRAGAGRLYRSGPARRHLDLPRPQSLPRPARADGRHHLRRRRGLRQRIAYTRSRGDRRHHRHRTRPVGGRRRPADSPAACGPRRARWTATGRPTCWPRPAPRWWTR